MHHYRQALVLTRLGESDLQIARAKFLGRRIAADIRHVAIERGWLDTSQELPSD